ncbi:MAG: hypothetical protein ABIN91_08445 [Mucilaginibacter sp.]|uniref:hypothetical protein n=1 Tax=Mucilaginibacter sp. TaxID=1882438 RepID=UPI003264345B
MKAKQLSQIKYKLCCFIILILTVQQASAQVDYSFGLNKKGFRLGIGVGLSTINTHYQSNPAQIVGVGSLDYDFNPYFSIGLEAQGGYLKGVDKLGHLYYQTSKNQYLDANINFRVAIGLISDFYAKNNFQDIVKNIYIGAGVGRLRTSNTFTIYPSQVPPQYTMPILQMWSFPFNLGTNINIRGSSGADRFSINPNFQFSYVNNYYLDGYRTSDFSHLKGFYKLTSVRVKYKF